MTPDVTRVPAVRPALVYVALFASVGAYVPYVSVYYREVGIGLGAVGLLVALSSTVGLVAAPTWGAAADQVRDVRIPLVTAGLASAAAAGLLAVARDPIAVAIAVVLLAAATAGIGPMLDSRTIELLGDRERYGRVRAWGSAAFIGASLVTGAVVARTSAVGLFAVQVPLLLVSALAAWLLLGGRKRERRSRMAFNPIAGLSGVLRAPRLGLFFVGSVLVWVSVTAVTTFISIHVVALGGDAPLVGILWSLGALIEVPLMFAFPAIARRFGAERLLVFGALAFAARSAGWALTPDPILIVAIAPLGGIGFALFYVGTVAYVSAAVPASVQATAQGLFSGTAFSLGSILGSLLGGVLAADLSLRVLFGIGALGTVAAAGVVARAVATTRPIRAPRPALDREP